MLSSGQRQRAIEGLLLGIAVGDALGFAREGQSRRSALRMWGRGPLKYRLLPGRGIGSDETQMAGMTAQAILESYSKSDYFSRSLCRRFRWWVLSLPVGIGLGTVIGSLKLWLGFRADNSGTQSGGNGPAVRALVLGAVLSETDVESRTSRWIELSTRMTHRSEAALGGAKTLAEAARISMLCPRGELESELILEELASRCEEPELRSHLEAMRPWLEAKIGPSRVAKRLGWKSGVSGYMPPSAAMAIYCWLYSPNDFRRAVESAILLGGDSDSIGAIVGGLAGLNCRSAGIPKDLRDNLGNWPANSAWHERLSHRLAAWPHGQQDITSASSESFFWPAVPIRNLLLLVLVFIHLGLRGVRRIMPI